MKTVKLTNSNVIEKIRDSLPVSTNTIKGLLSSELYEQGVRVDSKKIYPNVNTCIKVLEIKDQSVFTGILIHGRIEASAHSAILLDCTTALAKIGQIYVKNLGLGNVLIDIYYTLIDGVLSVYLVTKVDYSTFRLKALMKHGSSSSIKYLEETTILPEGAVKVSI